MKSIASLTFAALLAVTGTVSAARPATIAQTSWILQANGSSETLEITTQGGPGAPGAADCRHINGYINNGGNIRGWYCPATGRIHFVHTNVGTGNPVRVFTGNLSDEVAGQLLYMAGTMTVLVSPAFGDLGEYNFSASR